MVSKQTRLFIDASIHRSPVLAPVTVTWTYCPVPASQLDGERHDAAWVARHVACPVALLANRADVEAPRTRAWSSWRRSVGARNLILCSSFSDFRGWSWREKMFGSNPNIFFGVKIGPSFGSIKDSKATYVGCWDKTSLK